MNTAFGITEEDFVTVLENHQNRIINQPEQNIGELATRLFSEFFEFERVEKAALDSGIEMDEQINGAYAEIATIFEEDGILAVK